eukprot:4290697-Amphidinium_carterae.1
MCLVLVTPWSECAPHASFSPKASRPGAAAPEMRSLPWRSSWNMQNGQLRSPQAVRLAAL